MDQIADSQFIVGIGASAGGVEALSAFFSAAGHAHDICYIVQMHMPSDHKSILAEIIAKISPMPVTVAEEGSKFLPHHIMIMPPGVTATIVRQSLHLIPLERPIGDPDSIDRLFTALATAFGRRAIGVVLSGSGHDGTKGSRAIRERGGVVFVEAHGASATSQKGMPDSVVAAGLADATLPIADLPTHIAEYAKSAFIKPRSMSAAAQHDLPRTTERRLEICQIVQRQTDHDFSGHKPQSFMRRVHRRLAVLRVNSLDAYIALLRKDPHEVETLFAALLIGVTSFFRDPEAFAALKTKVIPHLFQNKGPMNRIRVWVPGCASGEEAYSIAILLLEYADTLKLQPQIQIFATDINSLALRVARKGEYPTTELANVPEPLRDKFFNLNGASATVRTRLREICTFSEQDIIRDPPFSKIDLVSFRNVIIYLDNTIQSRIFPLLHFSLRQGGYLFLGSAEGQERFDNLFTPIDKRFRVYQRVDRPTRPLPASPTHRTRRNESNVTLYPPAAPLQADVRKMTEAVMLDRFTPPHVIVNRLGEIEYFSAHTGPYLEAAPGQPTRELLVLARRWLRADLQLAFLEAQQDQRTVTRRVGMGNAAANPAELFAVTVEPLKGLPGSDLLLVVFERHPVITPLPEIIASPTEAKTSLTDREVRKLREQIQTMQLAYESTVEELRASNEELMSVNEEFQSSNEELETSKEEQQSINEELQTVNAALTAKVDELDRATADLRNTFEATKVATITIDLKFIIRAYSPAIARIFSLLPQDVGRPLYNLAGKVGTDLLLRAARAAIADGAVVEQRIAVSEGNEQYLLRAVPYQLADGRIDGAVLGFIDITELLAAIETREALTRAAAIASAASHELNLTLTQAPVAFIRGNIAPDNSFTVTYISPGIERVSGWPRDTAIDELLRLEASGTTSGSASRLDLVALAKTHDPQETFEIHRPDGRISWLRLTSTILFITDDRPTEIVVWLEDVTAQRKAEAASMTSARLSALGEMSAGLAHELKQPLQTILLAANTAKAKLSNAGVDVAAANIDRIATQAQRAADIIDHLRRFARGEADNASLSVAAIRQPIDAALSLVAGVLHEINIEISVILPPDLPAVAMHETALEHVFVNLFLNARDAMAQLPSGKPRWLRIEGATTDGGIQLSICDNGGGIPADVLPRLFTPFVSTKGPDKGTGLGLSVCRGLIGRMGGTISIENSGEGAVVTVTLPTVPPQPAAAG